MPEPGGAGEAEIAYIGGQLCDGYNGAKQQHGAGESFEFCLSVH